MVKQEQEQVHVREQNERSMDTSSSQDTSSGEESPQSRRRDESSEGPRRSSRQIQPSIRYTYYALMSHVMNVVEPIKYDQAKEHEEWRNAMNDEYDSLMKNQTWELVELPENKVPIGRKLLYKDKFKADGSIDKYKARLVAKGYSKNQVIDYEDTFEPVAKLNKIRVLISLATKHNWKIHQLDVKYAFLDGDLKEEVYLVQPKAFVKQGHEHLVYRLRKELYGLK